MVERLIRNIAIIAHVDHGKTTLVDKMLYQSGMFRNEDLDKLAGGQHGLIMDSNDLERERGITILAKNCAIQYHAKDGQTYRINIIDTPGHADFGGEVERVLQMADGALLLVDSFEGPMPQTRFVLGKALRNGLKPIVVVNKIDRPEARPEHVVNEVFDLLVDLGADEIALDFPVVYASGRRGVATLDLKSPSENLLPLFETIVGRVPAPQMNPDAPLQMLVTTLDYSDYTGRIAIGRVMAGRVIEGQSVRVHGKDGHETRQKVAQVLRFEGLQRGPVHDAEAGDICAIVGLDPIDIGDTIACPEQGAALPRIAVDEPTLHMNFRVNDGPFAGKVGKFVTSRQIRARLDKELQSNVALRVEAGLSESEFKVSGRGLMHLGILIENMRREGFELCVGKPTVILREIDGRVHEPVETLVVDCPGECQSAVMALLGDRRAEMLHMDAKAGVSDYVHLEFAVPARGLIGLRPRMLNATQGRAIMHHTFRSYQPLKGEIPSRSAGVLVSLEAGQVTAYALDGLYDRGFFFVRPGDQVYEGQVVGEHCKDNDLTVNVVKGKQLTNMRTTSKDDAARIRPARVMSLEACLEYIEDDELVEVTPEAVRMRKRMLKEADRRRDNRKGR
jgi:GTP-binding protein